MLQPHHAEEGRGSTRRRAQEARTMAETGQSAVAGAASERDEGDRARPSTSEQDRHSGNSGMMRRGDEGRALGLLLSSWEVAVPLRLTFAARPLP